MGMKVDSDAGDCYAAVSIDGETIMVTAGSGTVGIMFAGMPDYCYLRRSEADMLIAIISAASDEAKSNVLEE